jgi:hypothetical protein
MEVIMITSVGAKQCMKSTLRDQRFGAPHDSGLNSL